MTERNPLPALPTPDAPKRPDLYRRRVSLVTATQWAGPESCSVGTIVGTLTCNPGDWIVETTPGSRFVVAAATFAATYEDVPAVPDAAALRAQGFEECRRKAESICAEWVAMFGDKEIRLSSPREYAVDVVKDVGDSIAALKPGAET